MQLAPPCAWSRELQEVGQVCGHFYKQLRGWHYVNIVQVSNAQNDLCHEITIPFVHHTMRLISLIDHLFQSPLRLQKGLSRDTNL